MYLNSGLLAGELLMAWKCGSPFRLSSLRWDISNAIAAGDVEFISTGLTLIDGWRKSAGYRVY